MTRQAKNTRNRNHAKQFTALHLRGEKGPKSSTPKHGKQRRLTGDAQRRPQRADRLAA